MRTSDRHPEPPYVEHVPGGDRLLTRGRAIAIALALVAVVGVSIALVRPGRSDRATPAAEPPTSTTATVPSTTAPQPSTTAPSPAAGDYHAAVWPDAAGSTRFEDPVAAARSFAVDFVGFRAPLVGEFQQGDSRSGEVPVRPVGENGLPGPATTVLVRQLGADGTWWVLGSATDGIRVSEPQPLAAIASPVHLTGTSTAFEANVQTQVREDGNRVPLGQHWVMGGANGEMGPFDGYLEFSTPHAAYGAVVLLTHSMANGDVWEASVVRVGFGAATAPTPASLCQGYRAPAPAPGADQMVVTVFYSCGTEAPPVPVYRLVPATAGLLRASLEQLLAGPTVAERNAGLGSWFGTATAGLLDGVTITNVAAVVDLDAALPTAIPNASTSAGSKLLLDQLDATVFQFPTVASVTYRLDGNCEAFSEWLQYGGCEARTRT
ncbi:MAG TPA: Gmad2 immunoglobulin-like domain-containing protein [Acidimicrobiales bacterium]|nr:Gmad2 immunoglobulin-like domain-containing protein [Acidimicrobiales bacterium]